MEASMWNHQPRQRELKIWYPGEAEKIKQAAKEEEELVKAIKKGSLHQPCNYTSHTEGSYQWPGVCLDRPKCI